MLKKLIAFDLDGTLAPSKSPVPDEIVEMLEHLLVKYTVCIISGGKYEQFQKQVLSRLNSPSICNLHLLPTCGTKYYLFSAAEKIWNQVYSA